MIQSYSFLDKRYATWTDEILWTESARLAGLSYGVYDHDNNRKCTTEEQGGIITSYEEARAKAIELNEGLKK